VITLSQLGGSVAVIMGMEGSKDVGGVGPHIRGLTLMSDA
jgi:hypothetical protein